MIRPEPLSRPATYRDVLAAPEHRVAELIDGELFLQPLPAKPHTDAASVLGMLIGSAFDLGRGGPGGWWIRDEPEIHFGEHVLVPDLAGWRRSETPDFDRTIPYYTERPDWVCEVLSPATAQHDRLRKLTVYATFGVQHTWLVDARDRFVEVFRNQDGAWLRVAAAADREVAPLEPFDAVPTELALLWHDAPPSPE